MTDNKEEFKNAIFMAKEKLAVKTIEMIVKDLDIEGWNGSKGCCPFHSEDTPSFSWNEKGNHFHCFGCNKTYDYLNHQVSHYGLSYKDAIKKLFDEAEMDVPLQQKSPESKASKKLYKYPKRIADENRSQVDRYLNGRGISNETIDFFDITSNKYGNILFNYYDQYDVLTFIKAKHARELKKGEDKFIGVSPSESKKLPEYAGASSKPVLYGMNKCVPSGILHITEGECFPPSAEILTENGWVTFDKYDGKDRVMSVDENMTGSLVYPSGIIKKNFSGNLVKFQNRNYFSLTTPKHNLVYVDKNGNINKTPADEMPMNIPYAKIPMAIRHSGDGVNFSNSQLALLIAVSADGTLDQRKNGNKYVRIQFKKQRKTDRFEEILNKNGIKYIKTNQEKRPGYTFFGFTAPSWLTSKVFDHSMLLQMSQEQKDFFISEILYWDGNTVPNRNQIEYTSKEYLNALFIQTLSHLCGYNSSIIKRSNRLGEWYKVSILFGKNGVSWQSKDRDKSYVPYSGEVYCVTVDTGMILVRQGGKISVSGNCDTLSLHESGFYNVVSIPFGVNMTTWIEYNYEWLEQFEQIVFWFDNDEPGKKAMKDAIIRIGHDRCRYVDIPKEYTLDSGDKVQLKDVNEALIKVGTDFLIELSKDARELPIEGILNLEDADDFEPEKWDGLLTGIKKIDDEILYKFFFGTVVTVTGTPGSGKSTLVNQFFINEAVNQGYGVTIFSGELPPHILRGWIEIGMAGREHVKMAPGNHFIRKISPETRKKIVDWYRGKIHVLKDDDNSLKEILSRAEKTIKVNGDKVLILDNLATMNLGENDNNGLAKQTEMMNDLKAFAGKYNVLVVLVVHPRKPAGGSSADGVGGYEMSGSGNIFNLCHYNLSVRRYTEKEREGVMGKNNEWKVPPILHDTHVQFYKNRLMGRIGGVDLYFDRSYRFYTTPSELWKRYGWDADNPNPVPTEDPNEHSVFGER